MLQDSKFDLLCTHDVFLDFYTRTDIYHYSSFDLNYTFHFKFDLRLHLQDNCFANVFDSFIPVIMLNIFRFTSSVFFGTHALLDKSLKVLQFPTHISKLTTSG